MAKDSLENGHGRSSVLLTGLIPSMFTIMGLCSGITAVRFAMHDRWELSVMFILLAAIIDGIDGRVARMLNATSRFGAELDSLADVISFGVAPALVLYQWQLMDIEVRGLGWTLCLLFVTCCAVRLARFNSGLEEEDAPEWKDRYFTGIPAPGGACLLMLPLVVSFYLRDDWGIKTWPIPVYVTGIYMASLALLMVSRLPTFSIKHIKIRRSWVSLVLAVVGALIAFLIMETWATLIGIAIFYWLTLPFGVISFLRVSK